MPWAGTTPIMAMYGEGKAPTALALDLAAALQASPLGLFHQFVAGHLAGGLPVGGALPGEAVLDVFGLAGIDRVVGDGGLGLVAARVGAWVVGVGAHTASLPSPTGIGQGSRTTLPPAW